jgi:chemotaxis protein methyltransferase CheR
LLTTNEYVFLFKLAKQYTGIQLDLDKQYLIDSRLSKFILETNYPSIRHLVNQLITAKDPALSKQVAYCLLTHETLFFRDNKHFNALINDIIPNHFSGETNITIWSAACSTGQEPYSISIATYEQQLCGQPIKVEIIASDVSEPILAYAMDGLYSKYQLTRGLTPEQIEKYFIQKSDNEWKINPKIQNCVKFMHLNLYDPYWQLPKIDVVFIRNVLIYFDEPARKKILNTLKNYLQANALIITGTGEEISNLDTEFTKINKDGVVYYHYNRH